MTNINFPDSPSDGEVFGERVYNATKGVWEWYVAAPEYSLEYLIIAGGGAGGVGGGSGGGGGGAGAYIEGTNSTTILTKSFSVTVGAGGAPIGATEFQGANGGDSSIQSIIAVGGGGGGSYASSSINAGFGVGGGSGGGGGFRYDGSNSIAGGSGTISDYLIQGYSGGTGIVHPSGNGGGGGGGSSQLGSSASGNNGGNGGDGRSSSITGTPVVRGGGGGGGTNGGDPGAGGSGGGGTGQDRSVSLQTNGDPNTGSGGGGGADGSSTNGTGGSGVVVLKISALATVSFGVGLVEANGGSGQTVGDYKVYTVTAGTGTVTIS